MPADEHTDDPLSLIKGEGLDERDLQLVELLAAGMNQKEAAKIIGVTASTVSYRYRNGVREAVRQVVRHRLESGHNALANAFGKAVDKLEELLNCGNEKIELRSAEVIVSRCSDLVCNDTRERLEALEAAIDGEM